MREIKFRAWDTSDKTMLHDAQATYDYRCTGKGCFEESFQDVIESNQYVVMQYTGLNDKNGKEIYEGDILTVTCYSYEQIESETTGVVEYSNELLGFGLSADENSWVMLSDLKWPYRTDYEVEGNIYENPEMLEV